jgi:hypothetical protein
MWKLEIEGFVWAVAITLRFKTILLECLNIPNKKKSKIRGVKWKAETSWAYGDTPE